MSDVAHPLHAGGEPVAGGSGSRSGPLGGRVDEARAAARSTAQDASEAGADAAASVRERPSDAAGDAKDRAADAYDDVRTWASDRYDAHRSRAADVADRGYRKLRRGRSATEDFISDNPLLVGVVGVAAGLLLGALLPRTRRETEALGPWADEVRDQGLRYARDVTQQGRAFVERTLDPDNLDAAVKRGASGAAGGNDDRSDRTAHRL